MPHLVLHHSRAPDDRALVGALLTHLSPRFAPITLWHPDQIRPGDNKRSTFAAEIKKVDIALLLISADYLSDDTIYNIELQQIWARHRAGLLRVIPVLLRPCDWQALEELRELQVLPRSETAISSYDSNGRDQAFADIVREIRRLSEELPRKAAMPPDASGPQAEGAALPADDRFEVQPDLAAFLVRQKLARTPFFRAEYVLYPGTKLAHDEVLTSYTWASTDAAGWALVFVSAYLFFHTNGRPEEAVLVLLSLVAVPFGFRRALVTPDLSSKIIVGSMSAFCGAGFTLLTAVLLDSAGLIGPRYVGLGVAGILMLALSSMLFPKLVPDVGEHIVSHVWIAKPSKVSPDAE